MVTPLLCLVPEKTHKMVKKYMFIIPWVQAQPEFNNFIDRYDAVIRSDP